MHKKGTFGDYLRPEFPSQLVVDITEYNNIASIRCPDAFEVRSRGQSRQNMPVEIHGKLVSEVKNNGLEYCRFVRYMGGGEPLLHPNIIEYITDMSAIGMRTMVTTNGHLLTSYMSRELIKAGVTAIEVTVDAYKPTTYDKVCSGGPLSEVQQGIRHLIDARRVENTSTKIIASFLTQEENEGEEQVFKAFWDKQDVSEVLIKQPATFTGLDQGDDQLLWEQSSDDRSPCLYPWERVMLTPDGALHFCPVHVDGDTIMGNYADASIKEYWEGPVMQALRQAHMENDFSCHGKCGQCPDWFFANWPGEVSSKSFV